MSKFELNRITKKSIRVILRFRSSSCPPKCSQNNIYYTDLYFLNFVACNDTPLLFISWLQPSHNALCVLGYILSVHLRCLFDRSHSSLLKAFGFLRSLPTIHSFHQSLTQRLEAILKMYGRAIFEAIEVKGRPMLNFETAILIFWNHFWKFCCLWGTIKKPKKSELWNLLPYRGLPYFFEVGSQTFRNYYKTWVHSLKIQHWSSFDLNDLKNHPSLYF